MVKKSASRKLSLSQISSALILALCVTMSLASSSYAGGGTITDETTKDYTIAPAIGSNVVGYVSGEYLSTSSSSFSIFVRKCECLKRLTTTDTGVLVSYPQVLSQSEFDAITSTVLVGMIDPTGQLSAALGNGLPVVAVIERVLEFKKVDTRFVARVSIKFVLE